MVIHYDINDIWSAIEYQLSDIRELLFMRLETEEEAVGKEVSPDKQKPGKKKRIWRSTTPHWLDDEIGLSVKAWLIIPYVDGLDQEALKEYQEAGRNLLHLVEKDIEDRNLTTELLSRWGALNMYAGALQIVHFSDTTIGHKRSALAGGEARIDNTEAHQRWFAHYFLRNYERGKRKQAEESVERLINAIIADEISVPEGWDVKWFESYLMPEKFEKLRPAFREHALSVRRMRELCTLGAKGIPPVDLRF